MSVVQVAYVNTTFSYLHATCISLTQSRISEESGQLGLKAGASC